MTPSVEVRLASVIHGLRDVIFPVVDPAQSLAAEQAGLIMGQLTMLLEQLPWIDRYHRLCRDDMLEMAQAIAAHPVGGPDTLAAAHALAQVAVAVPEGDPHADYSRLGFPVEALIHAVSNDGDTAYRATVDAAVLAFGRRQIRRERTWFRNTGFDSRSEELGTIAQLFVPDS